MNIELPVYADSGVHTEVPLPSFEHPADLADSVFQRGSAGTEKITFSLSFKRFRLFTCALGSPVVPTKVNPRNFVFEGRKTPLLLRLTRSLSVSSINFVVFSRARSPAFRDFMYRLQSSAYRQKAIPLFSRYLSSSSKTISDRIGLRGEPCGVPSSRGETNPFSSIPVRK